MIQPIDMGLPSGVRWAPYNVDAEMSHGFAISDDTYAASFVSWGNTDTHSPSSNTSFSPWTWGNAVNVPPYSESRGAGLSEISIEDDVANIVCGGNWRTPTKDDYDELLDNIDFIDLDGNIIEGTDKSIVVNGCRVARMRSKINGSILTFPMCGAGSLTTLVSRGNLGSYWTRNLDAEDNNKGVRFDILRTGVVMNSEQRYIGMTIRPVIYAAP